MSCLGLINKVDSILPSPNHEVTKTVFHAFDYLWFISFAKLLALLCVF